MEEFYGGPIGSVRERLDNDQSNQNLPEMRREHSFGRTGRALRQVRAKNCARQFP